MIFKKPIIRKLTALFSSALLVFGLAITLNSFSSNNSSFADSSDNPLLPGYSAYNQGAAYWDSSNLREWLNQSSSTVSYTNNPPSYSSESGFLFGFSPSEINAIEVTRHRSFLSPVYNTVYQGGSHSYTSTNNSTPFLDYSDPNINSRDYYYYSDINDKVFILSYSEIYEYAQKRGFDLRKAPVGSTSNNTYTVAGYYGNLQSETVNTINSSGTSSSIGVSLSSGIAPAIYLNGDYTFNDSRIAKNLAIGDIVSFGSYQNHPIEWQVINKLSTGEVLLWSTKILTSKQFNSVESPGGVRKNSNFVNFENFNVDITSDLKASYKNGNNTEPSISLVNLNDLNSRHNGNWFMNIQASDPSGVEKIILPDGSSVYSSTATVEVSENKTFNFRAVNNNGVYSNLSIPVSNINPPSRVDITASNEGWVNGDVTVEIKANNQVSNWETPLLTAKARDVFGPYYPNLTSYSGYQFHISGDVELVGYSKPIEGVTVGPGFSYQQRITNNGKFTIATTWQRAASMTMTEINNNKKHFDVVYTVPGSYFSDLRPWFQIDVPHAEAQYYTVEWTNLKYEFLNSDAVSVEKIILPDGSTIYDDEYSETLTEPGTYTYTVVDSRGTTTTKSIFIEIDKTPPTINFSGNPTNWINKEFILTVNGNDDDSGVKRIKSPDGEWTNSNNIQYPINQNRTYSFTVEDNAGNQTTKSIVVDKIDDITPINVIATAYNTKANISWTAPQPNGTPITNYVVTSNKGDTCQVDAPITNCEITGLTNGEDYNFTVVAYNSAGAGLKSLPSNYITPRTIPDAPTDVTTIASNGKATVSWVAPTFDGFNEIKGYEVTSNPGNLTCETQSKEDTSCVITNLINGTSYHFTVKALNDAGYSLPSEPSSTVTPMTNPSPPLEVTATPSDQSIKMNWIAPNDNGGSSITEYKITDSENNLEKIIEASDSENTYETVLEGLTNGTSYTLRVVSVNEVGESAPVIMSNITPVTVPGAPKNVSAVSSDKKIVVSWATPDTDGFSAITHYIVTGSPDDLYCETENSENTNCIFENLSNGVEYTLSVKAVNSEGESDAAVKTATPVSAPDKINKPSVVSNQGSGKIRVNWEEPFDNGLSIEEYDVTAYLNSQEVRTETTNSNSIIFDNLENGSEYTFTVKAKNLLGYSAVSAFSNSVIPFTVPNSPTNINATFAKEQADISWAEPDNGGNPITKYVVTSNPDNKTCISIGETNCVITGLTGGVEYSFTVKAFNDAGESLVSNTSNSGSPKTTPAKISINNIDVTVDKTSMTVYWSSPEYDGGSPITSYLIKVYNSKDTLVKTSVYEIEENKPLGFRSMNTAFLMNESPGNFDYSMTFDDLDDSEEYSFTITAFNEFGEGEESDKFNSVLPSGDRFDEGNVTVEIETSISLTIEGNDDLVHLVSLPNDESSTEPDNQIKYLVTTNSIDGYTVVVKADQENLIPSDSNSNPDLIPVNLLTIEQPDTDTNGTSSGAQTLSYTEGKLLYSQNERSIEDGDSFTSLFSLTNTPFVNADDYKGTITYTATAK